MRARKYKVIVAVSSTFLVCYLLSILIDGVVKHDTIFPVKTEPEAVEAVVDDKNTGNTDVSNEGKVLVVADDNGVTEPEEDINKTEVVTDSKSTTVTTGADNSLKFSDEAINQENEVNNSNLAEPTVNVAEPEGENSDEVTDTEDTEKTEDTEDAGNTENIVATAGGVREEEQLIGVFSSDDWFTELSVPPTSDYVIPNVTTEMNVREGPSTDTKIIGKLKVKSYAKLLERGEEWSQIESGKVTGYVSNDYLFMDQEALDLFDEWDAFQVKINAGSMNVREKPNTECSIIGQATGGEIYTWYPDESSEGWYAIQYDEDTIAYVSDVYTESIINLKTAVTIEEEEARVRAEKYAKALEQSKKNPPTKVNRDPIELTDEELYLMAVVIAMEALWESYEGKLAVANVIVNRMLDGYWGDTLHDVIYAPGQFSGANSGRVEEFWNQASEDCKRAAVEAAGGNNNIEDYMFFISLRKADYDKYYQYYVLGGHCFYKRKW